MDSSDANPIFVILFFLIRCLVPLTILLGISYILKKLGLIRQMPEPPLEPHEDGSNDRSSNNGEGGLAHA
jgi:hypothetical protein